MKIGKALGELCFVAPSRIHGAGRGLFASTAIAKNTRITWYEGERLDRAAALRRADSSFLRSTDYYTIIDGTRNPEGAMGGASFANHSAHGNVRLANVFDKRTHSNVPVLIANRHIDAGEELLYNYGRHYWKRQKDEEEDTHGGD